MQLFYSFVLFYTEKVSQNFVQKNDSVSCLGYSLYFLQTDHPEALKAQQDTPCNIKKFRRAHFTNN